MDLEELTLRYEVFNATKEEHLKEMAIYDYNLANLIGYSVNRFINAGKMPALYEIYPSLFEDNSEEEKLQKQMAQVKAFAIQWNNKYEETINNGK